LAISNCTYTTRRRKPGPPKGSISKSKRGTSLDGKSLKTVAMKDANTHLLPNSSNPSSDGLAQDAVSNKSPSSVTDGKWKSYQMVQLPPEDSQNLFLGSIDLSVDQERNL
jgi:hypothetical protein